MSVNTESNVVKLHLAKAVEQLNAMFVDSKVDLTKMEVTMVIKTIEKMYNAARESFRKGDEERAYILYMRTVQVYMKAKNRPDFDSCCKALFGEAKAEECFSMAEKLLKSLERRYQALLENSPLSTRPKTDEPKITSTASVNHVNSRKSANDHSLDPLEHNQIQCTELFDLVEQFKVKQKEKSTSSPEAVLLIDARSAEDFRNSRMKFDSKQYDSSKVNVINIPETVLREGLASEKLAEFVEKQNYTKIVIFDWSSKRVQDSKDLNVLFKALWKVYVCQRSHNNADHPSSTEFGNTVRRAKSVPMVLKGGYQAWFLTYPICITNDKVSAPRPTKQPPKPEKKPIIIDFLLQTDASKEPPKHVDCVLGKKVEIQRAGFQTMTEKFNKLLNDNPSPQAVSK